MANEIPCAARLADYNRQMASLLKATRPVAGGAKTSLFIAFLFKISKTPQLPDLPIEITVLRDRPDALQKQPEIVVETPAIELRLMSMV